MSRGDPQKLFDYSAFAFLGVTSIGRPRWGTGNGTYCMPSSPPTTFHLSTNYHSLNILRTREYCNEDKSGIVWPKMCRAKSGLEQKHLIMSSNLSLSHCSYRLILPWVIFARLLLGFGYIHLIHVFVDLKFHRMFFFIYLNEINGKWKL